MPLGISNPCDKIPIPGLIPGYFFTNDRSFFIKLINVSYRYN